MNVRVWGGVEVQLHAFLPSVLDKGKWLASRLGCLTIEKEAPLYTLTNRE